MKTKLSDIQPGEVEITVNVIFKNDMGVKVIRACWCAGDALMC
jgi:hypothetical protein